ncbi:hypothetical protein C1S70_30245 (plasmid) [Azospirillum argentinense]|uniref:Gfo/Idh/MocA-like oxidoreductase N-terminal domain-containing protein n=1 Tax=Azospirillum argentinense TaxID=2970906 RepID=A0A2K1FRM2_9PROT|nr:Gfo/Idh/MocA family oxidoreductase [Azospirillum argentinense]PNQ95170.1 hypothetical protein C1S70_30245 [Azospirillum argentinense]
MSWLAPSLRAAVIGCGAIGCRMDRPNTLLPSTHAGGYRISPGFSLVALADTDDAARDAAAAWGCPVYADPLAMLAETRPDVVSLCLPVSAQVALLECLPRFGIRAVVAEKPLAGDAAEGERIRDLYRAAGIPLLVNFTRRFVGVYHDLARQLAGRDTVLAATIRYAKGARHNGSHAIDLTRLLFGEVLAAEPLGWQFDWWDDDPTVTAVLRTERCSEVILQGLDERCFTLFEVDVFSRTGRWIIDQDHRRLRRWEVRDGEGLPPGRRLVPVEQRAVPHESAMLTLMAHLHDVVHRGVEPLCGAREALAAQRWVDMLHSKALARRAMGDA